VFHNGKRNPVLDERLQANVPCFSGPCSHDLSNVRPESIADVPDRLDKAMFHVIDLAA
jgi:hypothetical protein